jgi:hypothetical protein
MTKLPSKEGFYWAKWRLAAPGTADKGEGCAGADAEWEAVEVFDNSIIGDDPDLRVFVTGVAQSQPIENFFWGPVFRLYPPGPKTKL